MSDPICGACGEPRSRHYHEDQDYCNEITNGDVFTDEPHDYIVLGLFEEAYPNAREELVRQWRIQNGHEVIQ